ncbi:MAG TPA: acyl-CoA thioesterase [Flavobacteriia bacterium]|nr:acyl-CoA thioesterase [Flavobacteriia bacterium]
MLTATTQIRVRYSETDQMGYVYYGNYAAYFEVARVELLRTYNISYKELESKGIMLPVIKLEVNYHKPGKYDDLLTIKTSINKKPGVTIDFDFEIYNEQNELITTGFTKLVFIDMKRNRPTKPPKEILDLFS